MGTIETLLDKGSIQLQGFVKNKIADYIYKLVKERNNTIIGALIFECRKQDGFHSDSTSVYVIDRNAHFRPICRKSFEKNLLICTSKDDYTKVKSLHKLKVCPMLETEYQELKQLGLIK